jgi:hypothetical protein
MLGSNVYFVYLPGGIKKDEAKIKAFAGATQLSLYDSKIMLGAPGPRKVGAFGKEEEAQAMALALRQVGFAAFVIDKLRFSRLPKIFKALKAVEDPTGAGLNFTIETAPTAAEPTAHIFELPQPKGFVKAVVLGYYTQSTTRTDSGRSKFTISTSSTSQVRSPFIHLYSEDPHTVLEIHGPRFEFTWLQQMGTVSGDIRFKALAEKLAAYYGAKLDVTMFQTPEEVNTITAVLNVESTHGQSSAGATTGSSSSDDSPLALAASRIIVYSLVFGL